MNLLSDNIKSERNGGGEITYDYLVEWLLSSIETSINEGTIPGIQDAFINFISSFEPSELMPLWASITAESYSMKPLENSKVHNWEDDELITKELLQTIEDKLRISLTKTDLLNYSFLAYLTAEKETPEENPFDPFVSSVYPHGQLVEMGQLKTYFVGELGDMDTSALKEPCYFITSGSSSGLWEPRGLMEIYLLPTSNKSQLDDLEFEMDYRRCDNSYYKLDLDYIPFLGGSSTSELIAYCYLKPSGGLKISQRLEFLLSYSGETGLYTGSDINVASTYGYTCSFDPKTWKFTLSLGESVGNKNSDFGDILGKEIVGVSVQAKNGSYINAQYAHSYYLNDTPYKRNIYVKGSSWESKITNDYSYTITKN